MELSVKIKKTGQKKAKFFENYGKAKFWIKNSEIESFSFSIAGEFFGHDQTIDDLQKAYAKKVERIKIDCGFYRKEVIRNDLKRAARVARSMGLHVKASTDIQNKVSSYYVSKVPGSKQFRISDHDIPWTEKRNLKNEFFDGQAHVYASAKPNRRNVWWRRAFILLLNDRDVPGYQKEREKCKLKSK